MDVEITPNKEINENENYAVNLLGLLSPSHNDRAKEAEKNIKELAKIFESAGMDVKSVVRKEDEVSIQTIKQFNRLFYDDLSLKHEALLPPEVADGW